jgi:hypothetical protein
LSFDAENTNLLAQALAELPEGKLYSLFALIAPRERKIIGILKAIQELNITDKQKATCELFIKFFAVYGASKYEFTELTALGLKVGHKNRDEIQDDE